MWLEFECDLDYLHIHPKKNYSSSIQVEITVNFKEVTATGVCQEDFFGIHDVMKI